MRNNSILELRPAERVLKGVLPLTPLSPKSMKCLHIHPEIPEISCGPAKQFICGVARVEEDIEGRRLLVCSRSVAWPSDPVHRLAI